MFHRLVYYCCVHSVEQIADQEKQLFAAARSYLGQTFLVTEEVGALYAHLLELIDAAELALRSKQRSAFLYCIEACQKEYLLGTLALLRGHVAQSAIHARRAIEFCAFGIEVFRSSESADIWHAAGQNNRAFKMYLSRFPLMQLIRRANRKSTRLIREYKYLSENFVHGSGAALPSEPQSMPLYDFGETADSFVAVPFFLFITFAVHTAVLDAFQAALAETPFATHSFALAFDRVSADIAEHKSQWLPVLQFDVRR